MARAERLVAPHTKSDIAAVFDEGCQFEGKLCFEGVARINGVFKGEIYTADTLIIGEQGKVHGNIEAGIVILSGEVNGNIKARHRVEVHRPAIFRGDIVTPSLQVEDGVVFEGSSRMASLAPLEN